MIGIRTFVTLQSKTISQPRLGATLYYNLIFYYKTTLYYNIPTSNLSLPNSHYSDKMIFLRKNEYINHKMCISTPSLLSMKMILLEVQLNRLTLIG